MMHTQILGILNVTPDSFSDGGQWDQVDAAIARGVELYQQGADYVDVGGESTRPQAAPVPSAAEQARVLPVVRELVAAGVPVSVDTMHADTAAQAIAAGVTLINDVSGGLADPKMAAVIAAAEVDYVAMHWRGHSQVMDQADRYTDVVREVREELGQRLTALTAAGVALERIILDPGLGFAKVGASNWPLLTQIPAWSHGQRVLIGASRKRFLALATGQDPTSHPATARDDATTALHALVAQTPIWGLRVHQVAAARTALAIAQVWQESQVEAQ